MKTEIAKYLESFEEREAILLARAKEYGMYLGKPEMTCWHELHGDPEQYLRYLTSEVNTAHAKRLWLITECGWLTEAQLKAYIGLLGKWSRVANPLREAFTQGTAMVQCFYSNGASMWVGIEPDGYTHS
jgi:hypothetical protein